ncbi:hypothetical protein GY45DRAFT_556293 [Cubamyces sp. BRFM 1775]|nr:hypothetical protein GY45DRAFT_556293 [Cubamyces sp. BRFM 1775]
MLQWRMMAIEWAGAADRTLGTPGGTCWKRGRRAKERMNERRSGEEGGTEESRNHVPYVVVFSSSSPIGIGISCVLLRPLHDKILSCCCVYRWSLDRRPPPTGTHLATGASVVRRSHRRLQPQAPVIRPPNARVCSTPFPRHLTTSSISPPTSCEQFAEMTASNLLAHVPPPPLESAIPEERERKKNKRKLRLDDLSPERPLPSDVLGRPGPDPYIPYAVYRMSCGVGTHAPCARMHMPGTCPTVPPLAMRDNVGRADRPGPGCIVRNSGTEAPSRRGRSREERKKIGQECSGLQWAVLFWCKTTLPVRHHSNRDGRDSSAMHTKMAHGSSERRCVDGARKTYGRAGRLQVGFINGGG